MTWKFSFLFVVSSSNMFMHHLEWLNLYFIFQSIFWLGLKERRHLSVDNCPLRITFNERLFGPVFSVKLQFYNYELLRQFQLFTKGDKISVTLFFSNGLIQIFIVLTFWGCIFILIWPVHSKSVTEMIGTYVQDFLINHYPIHYYYFFYYFINYNWDVFIDFLLYWESGV